MADAHDSKSCLARGEGSSPSSGTKQFEIMRESIGKPNSLKKSEMLSVEAIQKIYDEALARAKLELKEIAPSLKDLESRIETERPDTVVFLDMSARIFGTAFLQVLEERMGKDTPSIRFYNDDCLKTLYLNNRPLERVAEQDFETYRGKKVFIVDETYSSGKGAVALWKAAQLAGVDMHYFALTRDMNPSFKGKNDDHVSLPEEVHSKNVEEIKNNPHFTIYENDIKNLFSRFAVRLYVFDWEGETMANEPPKRQERDKKKVPSARDYVEPPQGMTMEEYEKKVRGLTYETVKAFKAEIQNALESPSS